MDHPWADADKHAHALTGFALGSCAAYATDRVIPDASPLARRIVALVPVVLIAVAKEVSDAQDRQHHTPEALDALATTLGGAVGTWGTLTVTDEYVSVGILRRF